jgi:hypothetical protein
VTELDKLIDSLERLQRRGHATFKTVYGKYNLDIEKLIKELYDNKLRSNGME